MTRILYLIPLVVMALICTALAVGLRGDPSVLPSAMVDRPLPEFDLAPIRNEPAGFKRADTEGQVSLINVFGSWCVACRIEHPTLMRLAEERAVPIYGVNWRDAPPDGVNWLKAYGDPYLKVGLDEDSHLAIDLGVTGAPETYIIDRSGRIRYKQIGPITDDVWKDAIQPLVTALEQEALP